MVADMSRQSMPTTATHSNKNNNDDNNNIKSETLSPPITSNQQSMQSHHSICAHQQHVRLEAAIDLFRLHASASGYVLQEIRLCEPTLPSSYHGAPRIVIAQSSTSSKPSTNFNGFGPLKHRRVDALKSAPPLPLPLPILSQHHNVHQCHHQQNQHRHGPPHLPIPLSLPLHLSMPRSGLKRTVSGGLILNSTQPHTHIMNSNAVRKNIQNIPYDERSEMCEHKENNHSQDHEDKKENWHHVENTSKNFRPMQEQNCNAKTSFLPSSSSSALEDGSPLHAHVGRWTSLPNSRSPAVTNSERGVYGKSLKNDEDNPMEDRQKTVKPQNNSFDGKIPSGRGNRADKPAVVDAENNTIIEHGFVHDGEQTKAPTADGHDKSSKTHRTENKKNSYLWHSTLQQQKKKRTVFTKAAVFKMKKGHQQNQFKQVLPIGHDQHLRQNDETRRTQQIETHNGRNQSLSNAQLQYQQNFQQKKQYNKEQQKQHEQNVHLMQTEALNSVPSSINVIDFKHSKSSVDKEDTDMTQTNEILSTTHEEISNFVHSVHQNEGINCAVKEERTEVLKEEQENDDNNILQGNVEQIPGLRRSRAGENESETLEENTGRTTSSSGEIPDSHVHLFLSSVAKIKEIERKSLEFSEENVAMPDNDVQEADDESDDMENNTDLNYVAVENVGRSGKQERTEEKESQERIVEEEDVEDENHMEVEGSTTHSDEKEPSPTNINVDVEISTKTNPSLWENNANQSMKEVGQHHQPQPSGYKKRKNEHHLTNISHGRAGSSSRRGINSRTRQDKKGTTISSSGAGSGDTSFTPETTMTASSSARPFKCRLCKSSFDRDGHLRVHILAVHEKKRPFVCQICNASFGHSSSLLRHVRTVHQSTPEAEVMTTTQLRSGRRHMAKVNVGAGSGRGKHHHHHHQHHHQNTNGDHSILTNAPFRCSVCGQTFNRVAILNRHFANTHSSGGTTTTATAHSTTRGRRIVVDDDDNDDDGDEDGDEDEKNSLDKGDSVNNKEK